MDRDWHWDGQLPTWSGLWPALIAADRPGDTTTLPSPIHQCIAGLVAAHRLREKAEADGNSVDQANAGTAIRGYRSEIDQEVSTRLPKPLPDAVLHHESYGEVLDRIARLYTQACQPTGAPRRHHTPSDHHLVDEHAPYGWLVTRLNCRLLRLPPTLTVDHRL